MRRKRVCKFIRMVPEKDICIISSKGVVAQFKKGEAINVLDDRGTKSRVWGHFRRMVFKRDNYTCQKCGEKKDISQLRLHHKKPVKEFPNLYYDIDNASTMCNDCHKVLPQGKRFTQGRLSKSYLIT